MAKLYTVFTVFNVDNSGAIRTQMALDRETESNYVLVIEVRDNGSPSNLAFTNVTILINDVNDNSPVFTQGAVLSTDPVTILEVSHMQLLSNQHAIG